jgi:hypothetical protein
VRHLHPHRLAGDLDVFMAPVELVGLAGLEPHRDERGGPVAGILAPLGRPPCRIAPDRIIGALEPLPQQQVMDPRHPQPIMPTAPLILRQQRVQPLAERTYLRKRLNPSLVVERPFRRADRLAHDLPRQP